MHWRRWGNSDAEGTTCTSHHQVRDLLPMVLMHSGSVSGSLALHRSLESSAGRTFVSAGRRLASPRAWILTAPEQNMSLNSTQRCSHTAARAGSRAAPARPRGASQSAAQPTSSSRMSLCAARAPAPHIQPALAPPGAAGAERAAAGPPAQSRECPGKSTVRRPPCAARHAPLGHPVEGCGYICRQHASAEAGAAVTALGPLHIAACFACSRGGAARRPPAATRLPGRDNAELQGAMQGRSQGRRAEAGPAARRGARGRGRAARHWNDRIVWPTLTRLR